ncbi:histone deacetylase [Verrucomicrobiota bacterium]
MAESKQSVPVNVGFVYDDIFLSHDAGMRHPECPERLRVVLARLRKDGLYGQLAFINAIPAPQKILAEIHTSTYIAEVKKRCALAPGFLDFGDTFISTSSYAAACMAAGAVLQAVDAVMEGKVRRAFCVVRPPGHHALPNEAMGFCIFNNIAVAARYLQEKHKVARVLIVDWDVHHGNGTQAVFYDDPTVLYFSVHRHPFYPGTGARDEQGIGRGRGFTVNIPLPAGSGNREYINAFKEHLLPAANRFRPDFVLVSAGFDAHEDDPLGGMKVTTDCYAEMTDIVVEIAETHCQGRLVSALEGGYDLNALAESTVAHVRQLSGSR